MAKIIETEMEGCLEQMGKLQGKMERLQKEAAEEVIKKTEIEPNLKIMNDWLETASPFKNGATFQRTVYLNPNHRRGTNGHPTQAPTEFMKLYIEATHNMFLIQQKRINELEKKIEEINLKL